MVRAESLYGIFVIFSGSWLCANISGSGLYLMSEIFSVWVCFAQKRNTNVCPSQYQFQIFCDQSALCSFNT
jgi:hypothetical protein